MADFTEKQIQQMMTALKWEFGIDNNTRELAILELEDLKRKGCTLEKIGECRGCSASTEENSYCPLADWEKRHPEYASDELAIRIKILEAGGEEACKAKLKAQEEAKKKAEEEANRATDTDKIEAICFIRRTYFEHGSEIGVDPLAILNDIDEVIKAKTKSEIKAIVAKQI